MSNYTDLLSKPLGINLKLQRFSSLYTSIKPILPIYNSGKSGVIAATNVKYSNNLKFG
jgi:hypothetical protein